MRRFTALLMSVWLGIQICAGYLAAPILFSRLVVLPEGKLLAAHVAGSMFHLVNYSALVIWLLVWLIAKQDMRRHYYFKSRVAFWAACIWILTAINEFLFTPVIVALRDGHQNWLHDLVGGRLGLWHGASSIIYMLITIIALGVCIRLLRLDESRR